MDPQYKINDTSQIISPAVVVFESIVDRNLATMVEMAGDVRRLRPHCKTHKMRQVIEKQIQLGVTKHKCATFAEAEMVADAGGADICLAYNLVGPNIDRAIAFRKKYPHVEFSATADHIEPVRRLSAAAAAAGVEVDVLLDIDSGQHRTGLPAGEAGFSLYREIDRAPGLRAGGIHLYDGQNHQTPIDERTAAVRACWEPVAKMRDELVDAGSPVPRIIAGGTGSFPVYAQLDDPTIELSPGTLVFFDIGYGELFPDLDFTPASLLLTRVVSRPTPDRLTVDLGYKAVASDPPMGKRVHFPDLPDAEQVLQNEEHLVLSSTEAERFQPGDELLAIPRHACPTSALHKQVYVVKDGELVDRWDVASRDRWLTI
ncbi:MAG: D-TA family PLP-dependent enzyme [Pirellulaceae bacterium]|jgi:D-serine deaminase-like pyridoxal phosphate-dependent protein|nr:D-TA family PLP-dependent enzyme [Pirellulaceae bacterium]MDP7015563.1 D-TA family PLP-dependent enzyme [Pirellulaceae bacterium]